MTQETKIACMHASEAREKRDPRTIGKAIIGVNEIVRDKPKMVHVRSLRCWNCMLLKKDLFKHTHSCPQTVFKDSELYPEYFACKCPKFEPKKEVKN